MQNDNQITSSGAEVLRDRIIAEAKSEAEAVIEGARVRAQEIQEETARETARIAMEAESFAQRDDNEILARRRTQAELEAKKHALKMRHAMIESVFQTAYRKLWEMEPRDENVLRFIYRVLLKEARGGETVYPSERHFDAVRIAMGRVNDSLSQMGKRPLTLGTMTKSIVGGFILDGETYIKDCSLKAILDEVRDSELTAISRILFSAPDPGEAAPTPPRRSQEPNDRDRDASENGQKA